jgi:YD repeat-containing protein
MMKKMVVGLFVLVALQVVLGTRVAAQNPCWTQVSCGYYSFYSGGCAPPTPVGAEFGCISSGTFGRDCNANNTKCPPPKRSKCNVGGKPICLSDGNTYIEQVDVKIPGVGGGLTLARTWNSVWPSADAGPQIGLFGPNWRSTFEERVFVGSDHFIKYVRSDGDYWSFGLNNSGFWSPAAPANSSATLAQDQVHWTLTFPSGEIRIFDYTTGNLLSIADRNGNTTQLSYDSSNRLVTVTDPASRHLYFGYANGSSFLVTSVTSDFGISLSYAYDAQGRLSQVTKPDSTTVSFTYNSQSLITAVTDSVGKILESHSYDANGRGLTSSRAAGVEALTVAY